MYILLMYKIKTSINIQSFLNQRRNLQRRYFILISVDIRLNVIQRAHSV